MKKPTKIIVLKNKELKLAGIFAGLVLILVIALIIHFFSNKKMSNVGTTPVFRPGIYTSSIILSGTTMDLEIGVDDYDIKYITLVNTAEAVATMYPLLSVCINDMEMQLKADYDTSKISYSSDNKYTSIVLINAINTALNKAFRN